MFKFSQTSFKEAMEKLDQESYARLMEDVEKVKAIIEKGLTLFLESSSNLSRASYPGVEL